ncbi:uncharacterized protein METZ01_LOCUS432821, partial [marine metagenome]
VAVPLISELSQKAGEEPLISIIHAIECLSIWIGRSFGWCILILTLSVAYEVFVR